MKFLLENEGLTENLRKTFLVFLISHQRPISELLAPNRKDISEIYVSEFMQMAQVDIPLEQLGYSNPSLNVLKKLIGIVKNRFLLNQDFIKIINRRNSIK